MEYCENCGFKLFFERESAMGICSDCDTKEAADWERREEDRCALYDCAV